MRDYPMDQKFYQRLMTRAKTHEKTAKCLKQKMFIRQGINIF